MNPSGAEGLLRCERADVRSLKERRVLSRLQFSSRFNQRPKGGESEGAADRDPADTNGGKLVDTGAVGAKQDIDWTIDRSHNRRDLLTVDHARSVQHVGAGLLVDL